MKKLNLLVGIGAIVVLAIIALVVRQFLLKPMGSEQVSPTSSLRIGFSLGDLREERWQKDRDLFLAAAKKMGAYVEVASANSNADVQNTQVENMISEKMDVIVIAPYDSVKIAKVVEEAHKANIKVISYDRLILGAGVDFYVTFDNVKVGYMEAAGVTAVTAKGNFAYIGGAPTDNNSVLLKQGSMEVLTPLIKSGAIKLVIDKQTPDWNPDLAYATIEDYLDKGGKLDAVVAANDGTALGVIRALTEHNLQGKVPVSGQDAELSACQRIIAGTQTMTVYKPIPALANKAAEVAVAMAKGEIPEANNKTNDGKVDVPSFYLDPTLVTKENMDATVIKDGFQAKAQVYQAIVK